MAGNNGNVMNSDSKCNNSSNGTTNGVERVTFTAALSRNLVQTLDSFDLGRQLIDKVGERYIAGHSLEEELRTIREYYDKGILSTCDLLGESVKNITTANSNVEEYIQLIEGLGPILASVSVKPSSISIYQEYYDRVLADTHTPLYPRMERILQVAKNHQKDVTIDMEDHRYTDLTIQTAQELWKESYDNLGIVLQSRLQRTNHDIALLFNESDHPVSNEKKRVRLCIGIYNEGSDIAYQTKTEAKENLLQCARMLFDRGVYVEFATHDYQLIDRVLDLAVQRDVSRDRYEFQFLKGVSAAEDKIIPELKSWGHKVRLYMPFEVQRGDGHAYMVRRCQASPEFVWYGMRNVMNTRIF